jgi:hypothetical protein
MLDTFGYEVFYDPVAYIKGCTDKNERIIDYG